MECWHYAYSGLSVVSNLHLPEWEAFQSAQAPVLPDLTIHFQPSQGETRETLSTISAEECQFFISDVGHYKVRASGEIAIREEPGADIRAVRAFLLGSALGAFYHLRGLLAFHASVVQVGDAAIAFCGESGAGKSTLAAWMNTLGHPLVSDDLCRIEFSEAASVSVYRSATRLKLWQDTLDILKWGEAPRDRDHARMAKFHVPVTSDSLPPFLPLQAIYLLVWGDLGLTRLTGLAALRRLIGAATYRGELLEPMERLGGYWSQCAELVQRVPVWEFSRPKNAALLTESMAFLTSHIIDKTL